jgi:hypothetical protein
MKTEQEIKDRIKKIENEIKILQSESKLWVAVRYPLPGERKEKIIRQVHESKLELIK